MNKQEVLKTIEDEKKKRESEIFEWIGRFTIAIISTVITICVVIWFIITAMVISLLKCLRG